jgi:hypothetical protein
MRHRLGLWLLAFGLLLGCGSRPASTGYLAVTVTWEAAVTATAT